MPSWPRDFKWSNHGVPRGYYCDRIWEAANPPKHTWKDNFFCWRNNKADPGIRFNMNGKSFSNCLSDGRDRKLQITSTIQETVYAKNQTVFFTSSHFAGRVPNSKCVQILEPADPHTWRDNYLCVPPNSPYHFTWVYSNGQRDRERRSGKTCIQWIEPADPHTWRDNYLCHYPLSSKCD